MIDEEIEGIIGGDKYDKEVAQPEKVKIWIDDLRDAPEGYVWIKTVNDFVDYIEKNGTENIGLIDTDHDAGDYQDFGGDYIRCFDYLRMVGAKNLTIHIHSANPVGANHIRQIISRCSDDGWKEVRNTSESEDGGDGKVYAYHVSNIPPETIRKEGFKSGLGGGATENNLFEELYKEDYPKNYLFISREPWDKDRSEKYKYVYKIDITGMDFYPDFGMLLDNGAYYDENYDEGGYDFWWKDRDLDQMKNQDLKKLIEKQGGSINVNEMMGGETVDGEYFPDELYHALGSAVIDGDQVNAEGRLVDATTVSEAVLGLKLDEDKKAYMKKYADQPNVKDVVDKFWNEIRKKAKGEEKDIEYWYKKPFQDLESFVKSFDMRNKKERKEDEYVRIAKEYGAEIIGEYDGYELWFIPSHEAARQIGRFYKGKSCEWCVSTDNPEYFNDNYRGSNFVFAVRKEFKGDNFDKLAFEIPQDQSNEVSVWSLDDENVTDTLEREYIDDVERIFLNSGKNRDDFLEDMAKRKSKDPEWLKRELFENMSTFEFKDGNVEGKVAWRSIDSDIIDHRSNEDLDYFDIEKIFKGEYEDMFNTFSNNDWDNILKYSPDSRFAEVFDDEIKDLGTTWKELLPEFTSGEGELNDLFNEDYSDGVGFYSVYSDCQESGRYNEARRHITNELKEKLPITDIKVEDGGIYLYVSVGGDALNKMVYMKLESAEENRDFLQLYLDWLDENVEISLPDGLWDEFDEDMMDEATKGFAKSVKGIATKQKDAKGQMFFDFDKDYNTNPNNIHERFNDDGISPVEEAIDSILGKDEEL